MACNFNCTQLFSLHLKGSIVTSNVLTLIHKQINNVFFYFFFIHSSSLISHYLTQIKSLVFTGSNTEQRFVTWASSIFCFLAVPWAVCVCMDRCARRWQLLISDCKVLITRAADLFLNSTTSKTLLEEEKKDCYLAKISFWISYCMITASVGELLEMYTQNNGIY